MEALLSPMILATSSVTSVAPSAALDFDLLPNVGWEKGPCRLRREWLLALSRTMPLGMNIDGRGFDLSCLRYDIGLFGAFPALRHPLLYEFDVVGQTDDQFHQKTGFRGHLEGCS